MKTMVLLLVGALASLSAGVVGANEEEARERPDRPNRQRVIAEFDEDGDGQLNEEERAAARRAMHERRSQRAGDRGRRGRGEGPPRHGPPSPDKLFDEFDADKDDQLSRVEFHELSEAVRERMARAREARRGQGRGDRGGRRRGPGPDADRSDSTGDAAEDQADDRPLGERARRARGDEAARGAGPRRGRGGPEGPPRISPERLLNRFDEDDNKQLDLEEFESFLEGMRRMRERMHADGPPRGRGPEERRLGPRGDGPRGDRRGGPERPSRSPRSDQDENGDGSGTSAEDRSS